MPITEVAMTSICEVLAITDISRYKVTDKAEKANRGSKMSKNYLKSA